MDYYFKIKNELINNEINKRVKDYSKNKNDIKTYYNVGKILKTADKKYGDGIIREYSRRLTEDLGKGFTITALTRMKKFYILIEKLATVSQLLSYSHYVELLAITNLNEIKYYIKITEENSLSVRELRKRIKSKEYDRLDDSVKIKLTNDEPKQIQDFIKNPIFIYNKNKYDVISEKVLQRLILEDISSFLNELGEGFTFIKNEYKIRIGTTYNYIDFFYLI